MAITTQAPQSNLQRPDDSHEFAVGQSVRLKDGFRTVGTIYVIKAKLPPNNGSPQYRIRNETENFERMAMQSSLEAVVPAVADTPGLI